MSAAKIKFIARNKIISYLKKILSKKKCHIQQNVLLYTYSRLRNMYSWQHNPNINAQLNIRKIFITWHKSQMHFCISTKFLVRITAAATTTATPTPATKSKTMMTMTNKFT